MRRCPDQRVLGGIPFLKGALMSDSRFVPSLALLDAVSIEISATVPDGVVPGQGVLPGSGVEAIEALTPWGFAAAVGQTYRSSEAVLVGVGPALAPLGAPAGALGESGGPVSADLLREAAAAYARAAASQADLATDLVGFGEDLAHTAQAVVEGVLLARYSYTDYISEPKAVPVSSLTLVVADLDDEGRAAVQAGIDRALILVRAAWISRDLANTPPSRLTAPDFADASAALAARFGLEVEVFDKAQLIELGCGGLLGVNAGSVIEPRMVRVTYTPAGESSGHLGLVGKGITYDSGGISLKPSNAMHAAMKMDMAGAGSVLAAMTTLADLGATAKVTAFLALTDNMPSGSATKLGDVLVTRSGRSIEVMNTDAEGRLVMSDAIDLAREAGVEAIIDVATLTGAALMALGPLTGAVIGNDAGMVDRIKRASALTDETVWELPLDWRYRAWMNSDVADIKNLGGESAGATTAALFLAEWVRDLPWAHLDIAGPMKSDKPDGWRTPGATGFGARLLAEVVAAYGA